MKMKPKMVILSLILAVLFLLIYSPIWAFQGAKFAVFSDPHVYDSSLGTEGDAFEWYLAQDRKLIRESEAILDATIDAILDDPQIQFVIVPGDLTKDGEKKNHHLFANKLKEIEKAGKQVYVIPGNHDINNPHAYRYVGDIEIPIPYVTPEKFKKIYKKCGYDEALYQDPNSLSYVAEPVQGLWLIAMDSCIYDNNLSEGEPATGGEFKEETLEWILNKVQEGNTAGKQMIGMMHHGVVEHYLMQSELFAEYVVADWPNVSNQLAAAGLKVVFTGHYHANDVTSRNFPEEKYLIDVETGSLLTFPSAYRTVTLTPDNQMEIESNFISEIDYDTDGQPFPLYAESYLTEGLIGIAYYMLQTDYGLPPGEPALTYATQLAEAFKAHYAGDEIPSQETLSIIYSYLSSSVPIENLMGQYLGTLWTDLAPGDTTLVLDLN